ncbi:hypothetical protein [Telmatospirillum siberiense]|uniref:Uncharacterized protein n=1 Tax=Telmatospirillum siberiense TaxID=382514 RepID=A0A2N3PZG6_9PROT|nr:hypothetical protein [Telmatospirillum siberiense]PKU25796.1 hypothetical protein CWS72_04330 [Telmatospirillum siberiense]
MANVGTLIPTPGGLRTVVQVLPGQTVPPTSQVVTLPISDANDSFPPIDYFGTPLPGQAQSAASFVQTLVMPGDGGTADSSNTDTSADPASTGVSTTASPATVITSPAASSSADTTGNSDAASTVGGTTSATPPDQNANASSSPTARQDISTHAATAYQTTQQRGAGQDDHHTLLIG